MLPAHPCFPWSCDYIVTQRRDNPPQLLYARIGISRESRTDRGKIASRRTRFNGGPRVGGAFEGIGEVLCGSAKPLLSFRTANGPYWKGREALGAGWSRGRMGS